MAYRSDLSIESQREYDDFNALLDAVAKNDNGTAWRMIARGVDVDDGDVFNLDGEQVYASRPDYLHEDLHGTDRVNMMTAMHIAAISGHLDMVKLLVAHGARINAFNARCITPLVYAIDHGHVEVVEFLLEHGADTTIPEICEDGEVNAPVAAVLCTPHPVELTKQKRLKLLELVLKYGASPDSFFTDGSPSPCALERATSLEEARALVRAGARIEYVDKYDVDKEIVEYLESAADGEAGCDQRRSRFEKLHEGLRAEAKSKKEHLCHLRKLCAQVRRSARTRYHKAQNKREKENQA